MQRPCLRPGGCGRVLAVVFVVGRERERETKTDRKRGLER